MYGQSKYSRFYRLRANGLRVIQWSCLGRKQCRFPLGTPGSSPALEATLERGAPRDNQAKTENSMALKWA